MRFEPSSRADLDAHAARVALLAEDLFDAPADALEQAIAIWVRERPFLPKASDLQALVGSVLHRRQLQDRPMSTSQRQRLDEMNAGLQRDDIEWIRDGQGNLRLVDRQDWSERRTKEIAEERERERQRYNWRQQHPITEEREAAE